MMATTFFPSMYNRIEAAQVAVNNELNVRQGHAAPGNAVIAQLTLAAQALENAYDRVRRAEEAAMA